MRTQVRSAFGRGLLGDQDEAEENMVVEKDLEEIVASDTLLGALVVRDRLSNDFKKQETAGESGEDISIFSFGGNIEVHCSVKSSAFKTAASRVV